MIIASAVVNVLLFGMALLGFSLMENTTPTEEAVAIFCGVILVLNIFAVWGGMQAINRRRYGVSMISAIISIFGLLFFLGIIAVIFLALSKESFVDRPVKNNNFGNYGGGY
jgi:membrane protease YdiL (CAAX protease family)